MGDDLVLVTEQGKLIRTAVDGIRSIGRSTQGVRVMDPRRR
jgi:DNA gyrase/topoisomerase IV subunit A